MTNDQPMVSIVSPVYNGEAHLRECIESILAQTHTRWEYTIVNNCSTDRTLSIAEEYASTDCRIRIRQNEHFVPILENYNVAFRQVSPESKYCKVVAADDWLYPECIEKMIRVAEDNSDVAIVGSYGCRGNVVVGDGLPYSRSVIPGRELCRDYLLGLTYFFGTPTSLLYRSDIVTSRGAFFNESNLHADSEVCLEFLENSNFGFVHQVLSFSRVWEGSTTAFAKSFNTFLPYGVYILMRYGPLYLDEEQLKRRLQEKFVDYYEYLGMQLFRQRGSKFWEYHRGKLQQLGFPLNRPRLFYRAFMYGLDLALNPKRTLEALVQRLRARNDVASPMSG